MTITLPTPGGDNGTWGAMINAFLEVAHNGDGSMARYSSYGTTHNVLAYGTGVGTGSQTVDDAAIAAALAACLPGDTLFFGAPPVQYLTAGNISIPSNVRVAAAAWTGTNRTGSPNPIIKLVNSSGATCVIGSATWLGLANTDPVTQLPTGVDTNIVIENMSIDVNGANNPGSHGIALLCYRAVATLNYVENLGVGGGSLNDGFAGSGILMADSNYLRATSSSVLIHECRVHDNTVIGTTNNPSFTPGQYGIWWQQTPGSNSNSDNLCHDNIVAYIGDTAFQCESSGDLDLHGNHPWQIYGANAFYCRGAARLRLYSNVLDNTNGSAAFAGGTTNAPLSYTPSAVNTSSSNPTMQLTTAQVQTLSVGMSVAGHGIAGACSVLSLSANSPGGGYGTVQLTSGSIVPVSGQPYTFTLVNRAVHITEFGATNYATDTKSCAHVMMNQWHQNEDNQFFVGAVTATASAPSNSGSIGQITVSSGHAASIAQLLTYGVVRVNNGSAGTGLGTFATVVSVVGTTVHLAGVNGALSTNTYTFYNGGVAPYIGLEVTSISGGSAAPKTVTATAVDNTNDYLTLDNTSATASGILPGSQVVGAGITGTVVVAYVDADIANNAVRVHLHAGPGGYVGTLTATSYTFNQVGLATLVTGFNSYKQDVPGLGSSSAYLFNNTNALGSVLDVIQGPDTIVGSSMQPFPTVNGNVQFTYVPSNVLPIDYLGNVDATAVINTALTAAATQGGGVVKLGNGNVKINSGTTTLAPIGPGVRLEGSVMGNVTNPGISSQTPVYVSGTVLMDYNATASPSVWLHDPNWGTDNPIVPTGGQAGIGARSIGGGLRNLTLCGYNAAFGTQGVQAGDLLNTPIENVRILGYDDGGIDYWLSNLSYGLGVLVTFLGYLFESTAAANTTNPFTTAAGTTVTTPVIGSTYNSWLCIGTAPNWQTSPIPPVVATPTGHSSGSSTITFGTSPPPQSGAGAILPGMIATCTPGGTTAPTDPKTRVLVVQSYVVSGGVGVVTLNASMTSSDTTFNNAYPWTFTMPPSAALTFKSIGNVGTGSSGWFEKNLLRNVVIENCSRGCLISQTPVGSDSFEYMTFDFLNFEQQPGQSGIEFVADQAFQQAMVCSSSGSGPYSITRADGGGFSVQDGVQPGDPVVMVSGTGVLAPGTVVAGPQSSITATTINVTNPAGGSPFLTPLSGAVVGISTGGVLSNRLDMRVIGNFGRGPNNAWAAGPAPMLAIGADNSSPNVQGLFARWQTEINGKSNSNSAYSSGTAYTFGQVAVKSDQTISVCMNPSGVTGVSPSSTIGGWSADGSHSWLCIGTSQSHVKASVGQFANVTGEFFGSWGGGGDAVIAPTAVWSLVGWTGGDGDGSMNIQQIGQLPDHLINSGLTSATFDAAAANGSGALVAGSLYMSRFVAHATSFSELLFGTSVAATYSGTGAEVFIWPATSGAAAIFSALVDSQLKATAGTQTLSLLDANSRPLSGLVLGQAYYIGLYIPSGLTGMPTLRGQSSASDGLMDVVNVRTGTNGAPGSQGAAPTTCPNPGALTTNFAPWYGLL